MAKRASKENKDQLLLTIVNGIEEVKGQDIVVLDLLSVPHAMADYFVICHGSSSTQVEAISRSIEDETRKNLGERPGHVEGARNSKWILMDYFNIVVHIFDQPSRQFYGLEELWADGKVLDLKARA